MYTVHHSKMYTKQLSSLFTAPAACPLCTVDNTRMARGVYYGIVGVREGGGGGGEPVPTEGGTA